MLLTGILSRSFLNGFHNVQVSGVERFQETLKRARNEGRGVLTVANHISVIDDPLLWGLLPLRSMTDPKYLRWSLGAENICFTTKLTEYFFSMGQVLSTRRFGVGPYQGAIDSAILLLSPSIRNSLSKSSEITPATHPFPSGDLPPQWVHIFPESLVHQAYPPHKTTMKYFHWGVSRVLLEAEKMPIVVPVFHHGLEDVFPEDRESYKYVPRTVIFPRFSKKKRLPLNIKFGSAIDDIVFADDRIKWEKLKHISVDGTEARSLRSAVALKLRDAVSKVRSSMGLPEEDSRFKDVYFWSGTGESNGVKIAGKYGNSKVSVIEKDG
ncbi:hypothetical protein V1512DRAFT_202854 [Lipomyces arxii]|uniref:uncharacterized protein n=1 Tax=Lipomyces arxii TaxID=56418 RepID=UPI0034CD2004